jgi:capsid protein
MDDIIAKFNWLQSRHALTLKQRDDFRKQAAKLRNKVAILKALLDEQECMIYDQAGVGMATQDERASVSVNRLPSM